MQGSKITKRVTACGGIRNGNNNEWEEEKVIRTAVDGDWRCI